jgi:hypothetical protein
MALQEIQDITESFNQNAGDWNMDIGGWDYAVVHLITPSGQVDFLTSNDSGDITGVSDGSYVSAANFVACQGIVLATGAGATSLNATGLIRFEKVGRYLRLQSTAATVAKALVRLYKI